MILVTAQNQETEGSYSRRKQWPGHGTVLAEPTVTRVRGQERFDPTVGML
jgi:hypothetical protein